MINLRETLGLADEALTSRKVSYALIGGFALASHGVHRATQDIDFLADGSRRAEIIEALTEKGFRLKHATDEAL